MTSEQLAELFIEDTGDNITGIATEIEILLKQAYKSGYECAVNKTEEWLEKEAIHGWIEDEIDKFIEQYLKEIRL